MSLAVIINSVFLHLQAAGLPEPIYWPDAKNETLPQVPEGNHLRPFVLPSEPLTVGLSAIDQDRGLIQVSVYTKIMGDGGDIASAGIADSIVSLFARNTKLVGLMINRKGGVEHYFFKNGWKVTPVTIPYQNIS